MKLFIASSLLAAGFVAGQLTPSSDHTANSKKRRLGNRALDTSIPVGNRQTQEVNDVDSSTELSNLDTGILSTDEVASLEDDLQSIKRKYKRTHSHRHTNHRNHAAAIGGRRKHHKKKMGHLLAGGYNRTSSSDHTNNVADALNNYGAIVGKAATECTNYVICVDGYEDGTNNEVTCEEACRQNGEQLCCDGTYIDPDGYSFQACDGFTGHVCKDGSCSGDYSCFYANIDSVVNGCKGENSCRWMADSISYDGDNEAFVGMVNNSCIGQGSCYRAADNGGTITEIVNSCQGYYACKRAAGYAGEINSIHGSCVGNETCAFAGAYQGSIEEIKDSCHGYYACYSMASGVLDGGEYTYLGGVIGMIEDSCTVTESCIYAGFKGGNITAMKSSCEEYKSCYYLAAYYGEIGMIEDSCTGAESCSYAGYKGGNIVTMMSSCEEYKSCYYLAGYYGEIGTISDSCNEVSSCGSAATYKGSIGDITSSCGEYNSCGFVASGCYDTDSCDNKFAGGSVGHISASCRVAGACYDMASYEGVVGNVTLSCVGVESCERAAFQGSISDGIEKGCLEYKACLSLGESSTIDGQINDCCKGVETCANVKSFEATDCGEGTTSPTTSPTSSKPTTSKPTTSGPTTSKPTTSRPTTSRPTLSPAGSDPSTSKPTPTTFEPPYVTQFFDTTIMVKNVVDDELRNTEQVCESDERKAVFDITLSEIVGRGLPNHQRVGSAVVLDCTPDDADTLIVVQKLSIDVICGSSCDDTKQELEQSNELAGNIEDTMNIAIVDSDEYTNTLQNYAKQCNPPSECIGLTLASVNDPADVSPTPAPNSKSGKSSKGGKATKGSKGSSTTKEKNSLMTNANATKSSVMATSEGMDDLVARKRARKHIPDANLSPQSKSDEE